MLTRGFLSLYISKFSGGGGGGHAPRPPYRLAPSALENCLVLFWSLATALYCRITENVWKNQGFLKTDHGLLCTPDLVYCFFELVSYSFQRESIEKKSGRNSGLCILIQIFEFPAILPWLPMMHSSIGVLYETPELRQQQIIVFWNRKKALVSTSVFSHLRPLRERNDRVF